MQGNKGDQAAADIPTEYGSISSGYCAINDLRGQVSLLRAFMEHLGIIFSLG